MSIEEIKMKLENVLTPKRYIHSLNVMNTSVELAKKHRVQFEKAALAGLLHDCARDLKNDEIFIFCEQNHIEIDAIRRVQPELLHGPVGAWMAEKEYGVSDKTVLDAIAYHTTGRVGMELLDKIIFLADCIEPGRSFPGVDEIRKLAFADIEKAMLLSFDRTIKYVLLKGALVYPETINARNSILLERNVK